MTGLLRHPTQWTLRLVVLVVLVASGLFFLYNQPFDSRPSRASHPVARLPASIHRQPSLAARGPREETITTITPGQGHVTRVEGRWGLQGTMSRRERAGWVPLSCQTSHPLRRVDLATALGNLTIYVYNSPSEDHSVTARALRGEIFERGEITRFLQISSHLPLIDVGANVGLVALQAAMQGRKVVALEPVADNAIRLCRAALDFGHAHLLHVLQNAISSDEGPVTLAMDSPSQSTHYTLEKNGLYGRTSSFAIRLDRLLEIVHFPSAALKIDVEGHEGHVLAGAERLFGQMDIPLVWLEWEHVKRLPEYGGKSIIEFMRKFNMTPYDLITDTQLLENDWQRWPFTVLWKKQKKENSKERF